MRDQLVGYLCGALDEDEQAELERRLADEPRLSEELELLRRALTPLAADEGHYAPPRGLAVRTCDAVFASVGGGSGTVVSARLTKPGTASIEAAAPRRAGVMSQSGGELIRRNWRFIDTAIALGAIAAAALFFFPALVQSRHLAQMAQCQGNLQTVGKAFAQYATMGPEPGLYPTIPREGNHAVAGIYGVKLLESGFLESPKYLVCPSSPLAATGKPLVVPTSAELAAAEGEQLEEYQRTMGGSYGYALGFIRNGRYHPTQALQRRWYPVLADAFDPYDGRPNSCNHGGCGQNVLFDDGVVGYLSNCRVVDRTDKDDIDDEDIFRNARHEIAAGVGPFDFVLGDSPTNPWKGRVTIKIRVQQGR
jgi:hypothetical protein